MDKHQVVVTVVVVLPVVAVAAHAAQLVVAEPTRVATAQPERNQPAPEVVANTKVMI